MLAEPRWLTYSLQNWSMINMQPIIWLPASAAPRRPLSSLPLSANRGRFMANGESARLTSLLISSYLRLIAETDTEYGSHPKPVRFQCSSPSLITETVGGTPCTCARKLFSVLCAGVKFCSDKRCRRRPVLRNKSKTLNKIFACNWNKQQL